MIDKSDLSEFPQNFVQFVGYDKSKNHGEFNAALNKKANEYIVIRETLRSAGVPLDELRQKTDQIYNRLHNEDDRAEPDLCNLPTCAKLGFPGAHKRAPTNQPAAAKKTKKY